MSILSNVCVYCGSSPGDNPDYARDAAALGAALAEAGIGLVYGGGSVGLMGTVADAALAGGGHVTGIIPRFLADREIMHKQVQDLVVTADMHERKRLMFERADAFIALPGGIGTLEELVEMLTWAQLGRHTKPVMIANFNGYWDHLSALMQHMRAEGFLPGGQGADFLEARSVDEVVPILTAAAAGLDAQDESGDSAIIARL